MLNLIPTTGFDIRTALLILLGLFLLGLLIFRLVWLTTTDFYFPAEGYEDKINSTINQNGEVKLDGLLVYIKALLRRLLWLNAKYWTKYTGFEGRG